MSFIESIRTCLSEYADFNGRARRSEFWWFYLACVIVMSVVYAVAVLPGLMQYTQVTIEAAQAGSTAPAPPASYLGGLAVFGLISLGLLLPQLGAIVRRLHDTDRSGFTYFIAFIPFVGGIILLVWLAAAGTPGPNRFGADPKVPAAVPAA